MIRALLGLVAVVIVLGLVGTAIAACLLVVPIALAVALGLAFIALPVVMLLRVLRWGLR
jgi:hypothetical protein